MKGDRSVAPPLRRVHHRLQRLARRLDLPGVFVRIHSPGELDPEDLDPHRHQPRRVPGRRPVPRLVRVVGDAHPLHPPAQQRVEQLVREPFRSVNRRHVPEPVHPERQRVEHRLAQDHFRLFQGVQIPDAFVRPRQVQVLRRSRSQVLHDLPPVDFPDASVLVEHRHHHRPVEMLVPAFPEQAQRLQPRPDRLALPPVLVRQAQAQRPVGEADPEPLRRLLAPDPPLPQVLDGGRVRGQAFVIVPHRLEHQFPVAGVRRQGRFQFWHRRHLHPAFRRGRERRRSRVEQLEGVPEADPVELPHELDRVPRRPAAHAVIQPLLRTHDERRLPVRVERTLSHQVLAPVLPQLDPPRPHQRRQVRRLFDPFDLVIRDAGHGRSFRKNASSAA